MSPLADPMIEAPTQIYLPDIQYPGGFDVVVEVATWQATGQQKIAVIAAKGRTVIVMVKRR